MDLDIEVICDKTAKLYEDLFVSNASLQGAIDAAVANSSSGGRLLHVGCGMGKAIVEKFAGAGFKVHDINISQAMVDDTQSQGKGQFMKADMIKYTTQLPFDVIVANFSLSQLTKGETYSMTLRFSEWLREGGLLVLGTTLAESVVTDQRLYDSSGDCARHVKVPWNGYEIDTTLFTINGWSKMLTKTGFAIEYDDRYTSNNPTSTGEHYFVIAKKVVRHTLMGPYPLPSSYPGPHPLSEGAWSTFAERLVRDEFDAVLDQLNDNKKVLDIGSGYGKLPIELAKRLGKAFSIEPNMDRNSMQVANAKPRGVEVHQGRAESIPYPDHSFDAVVAMWVLHYVDDLDKSLEELVRVADPSAPNARIIIVQGAPDNEVVNMLNGVCAPLSRNPRIDHQGYILHKAADVFSRNGFADIAVHRVQAYCAFPEEEMDQRCEAAAEVLAKFWYIEDPSFGEMKQALIPELKLHFKDRPYTLTDEAAILVARATAN